MEDTIEAIPKTMEKFLGCSGKMVKPSEKSVGTVVGKIKKGKLATLNQIRSKIANDFNVNTACPAATTKSLQLLSKAESNKSCWRVVKSKGELINKLSGGVERQAEFLVAEGHEINLAKKTPVVVAFESKLATFA